MYNGKNVSNKEFIKMEISICTDEVDLMIFLIKHDKNIDNLKAYNVIINKYIDFCDETIHRHGSFYEPTGYIEADSFIPEVLLKKLKTRKNKIVKQFKKDEDKNELEDDDELKSVYEQITL